MQTLSSRAALAAALAFVVTPAAAHDGPLADGHAPAGVMTDHVHKAGEFMIGLRLSHDRYSGAMHLGSDPVSDLDVANAGYSATVQSMDMDMAMLDLMWAPSDRLTLMVMPQYMRMKMEMRGLPMIPANMGASHAGHMLALGATMGHSHEGFGDTQVAALLSLRKTANSSLHADFAVSVPTGSVNAKNEAGNFIHYGMQSGSGTWDLVPGLTWTARNGRIGWGAQARYIFRAEDANKSGFRFGDRMETTGWLSYRPAEAVSLSARALYVDEGDIEGHYNGPHSHSSPPDRQANYGGERLELGLGINTVATSGPLKGVRLGGEILLPVHQQVNGYQIEKKSSFQLNLSKAF